jgi:hypothetical protein
VVDAGLHEGRIDTVLRGDKYLFVRRVLRVLLVIQQFFKNLLAGTSPGDFDGDVNIRSIA